MKTEFTCSQCGEHKINESDISTGYGRNSKGDKVCFACCGINDARELEALKPKEKFVLYLDTKEKTLSNWPGSFKIQLNYIREGRHNIARKRYDTWFTFKGSNYHAVQFGDNTQIAHIRKTA